MKSQPTSSPGSIRFALALFVLSMAAVLYSLALFRLISFFIMPSLFFDLLLVGFPIGAAIAATFKGDPQRRFRLALPIFQLAMALTIGATLSLKHFDVMRENLLFNADEAKILIQIGVFSLIYFPFFVAYGATEYLGYVAGRESLPRRMNGVYAVILFGAAAALLVSQLQQTVGVARLLVMAIGLLGVVKLLFGGWRVRPIIELAVAAGVMLYPGLDHRFMDLFKSNKPLSVAHYRSQGPSETLFAGWGKYSYIEILQYEAQPGVINTCFYNDINQWHFRKGAARLGQLDFREQILRPYLKDAQSVLVIGAGGGRDVKLAREAGVEQITAIEVESAIVRLIQGKLKDEFDDIYNQPGVEVVVGDARSWLEGPNLGGDKKFDVIFFMSVGGYPQLMLEPGNMIRTQQALKLYLDHLTDSGVFVIGYDYVLDPDRVLLKQYATTFQSLGADVLGLEHGVPPKEYFLFCFSPQADQKQKEKWREIRQALPERIAGDKVNIIPRPELMQRDFSPVTDNHPYLAGNISNVLRPSQVRFLFYLIAAGLLVISCAIIAMFVDFRSDRRSAPWRVYVLAFLLGANFLMLEHLCVLEIFRRTYVYYDSLIWAVTAFLTITGIGSFLLQKNWLLAGLAIAVLAAALMLLVVLEVIPLDGKGAASVMAAALVVMTLVTGSMFPTLFERHTAARLHIFTLDAVGAAAGALLAFFLPIMYGFHLLSVTALIVFLITALLMALHWWLPHREMG